MNANQTFTAQSVNDSINFWDENLNLMSNEDSDSQKYLTFCNYSESESFDGDESIFFSKMESEMSSFDMLHQASTENDRCSLSSGEMIMRNNSFCLDNQAPVVVSSLDESISTPGIGAVSAESNLPSVTLPDITENTSDRVVKDKDNPCLNMTFTPAVNWDCPTEESDVALSSFIMALPTESEGGLLMTFIHETSAGCGEEQKLPVAEALPLPLTVGAVAQDQKSPLCESAGSTRVQMREKQISVAPRQHAVAGQTLNKSKLLEIKKFPKSDYSKIKSKIVTRAIHQMTAPGPTSQRKAAPAEINGKHIESQSRAKSEMTPAKDRKSVKVASIKPQTLDFGINMAAANVDATLKGQNVVNEQVESKGKQCDYQPAADEHASTDQCSDAAWEYDQTASHQAGSDPACLSTLEKSPNSQIGLQPAPKKVISSKNEVRSASDFGQNKPSAVTTRPRCSSESSSVSQPPKEKKRTLKFSTNLTFSRGNSHQNRSKAGNLKCSSQRELATPAKTTDPPAKKSPKEVDKISLVEQDGKSTSDASGGVVKSRFRWKTPSQSRRGAPPPQVPANPKPIPSCVRVRTPGKIECQTPKAGSTLPLKPKCGTGTAKAQSSLGSRSSVSSRIQLSGTQRSQTPIHPSLRGPSRTPSWRLAHKTGPSTGPIEAGEQSNGNISQVSRGAGPKPTPLKSISLKTKLFSTPAKSTKPALTSTCTPAASTKKTASASTPSLLKRSASARLVRPTLNGLAVDTNKSRSSFRQQTPQPPASKPSQSTKPPDVVPSASIGEDERKEHVVQQLRGLLAASNCRFEALAIVLQQSLAQRDEATKQCKELSQELVNLQGELVCSVNSSERLEKEKDELRVTLEDALHRVQEQHQKDLAELEQRLQAFYQAEWNKMHLAYQEEADKCNTVMKQQMGELEAKHEAMKQQIENSHVEQLQSVKQQYEISLDELRQVHHQELQSLDQSLKEAEASLTARVRQLTEENNTLLEKLTAEETRRKEWAQKSQKDSHTLYLEQELESLKVVLDMKTTQLHQQEKKLMEIDKLTEKNLKLDEILKKVQQENEDLKARMERHAALSRQLSTEQALLQESLQKESKVNKRLSMENEELLWKLNNDLSSSRKASPTSSSPSHSFSLQSPRSSGLLSSPPVSPR